MSAIILRTGTLAQTLPVASSLLQIGHFSIKCSSESIQSRQKRLWQHGVSTASSQISKQMGHVNCIASSLLGDCASRAAAAAEVGMAKVLLLLLLLPSAGAAEAAVAEGNELLATLALEGEALEALEAEAWPLVAGALKGARSAQRSGVALPLSSTSASAGVGDLGPAATLAVDASTRSRLPAGLKSSGTCDAASS
jgi:hypothetical protein